MASNVLQKIVLMATGCMCTLGMIMVSEALRDWWNKGSNSSPIEEVVYCPSQGDSSEDTCPVIMQEVAAQLEEIDHIQDVATDPVESFEHYSSASKLLMATRLLKTNRGGEKLVHCGYMYHLQRTGRENVSYWTCVRKPECAGRVKLARNGSLTVTVTREHNGHAPNNDEAVVEETVQCMKRKALSEPEGLPRRSHRIRGVPKRYSP